MQANTHSFAPNSQQTECHVLPLNHYSRPTARSHNARGIAFTKQTRNDERISLSIVCQSRSGKATVI